MCRYNSHSMSLTFRRVIQLRHESGRPNIQLKSLLRLRLRRSDTPKRLSVANGFAILSQLSFTQVRRLTGCYTHKLNADV